MPGRYALADIQPEAPRKGVYSVSDIDAPASPKPVAKAEEPTFSSRLYERTVKPLVDLGESVAAKTKAGAHPLAALGETGLEMASRLPGAAVEMAQRFISSPANRLPGGAPLAAYDAFNPHLKEDVAAKRYGAALGGVAGDVVSLAGPEGLGRAVEATGGATARRVMQSAIKPSKALAETPAEARAITETALDKGITANEGGLTKLEGIRKGLTQKVQDIIDSHKGATIDPAAVLKRTQGVESRFAKQATPEGDLADIAGVRAEFARNNPGPIPIEDAQQIKQGTYRAIKDNQFGKQSNARIETLKNIARGIKEDIEAVASDIGGVNKDLGDVLDLESAVNDAVRRGGNSDLLDLGDAATAGAGTLMFGPLGAATTVVRKVLGNPGVKSRLAIAIHRSAKASGAAIPFAEAASRASRVIGALMPPSGAEQELEAAKGRAKEKQ